MKRPGEAMATANPQAWHYSGPLDKEQLRVDHDRLVAIIRDFGSEVVFLEQDPPELADAVFTHDVSLVTGAGAVLLRMGKPLRLGEQSLHAQFYAEQQIPIIGAIQEPGTVEAGDCVWLDPTTLIVGLGFRTNPAGLAQLESILAPQKVQVHSFDLPVYQGQDACLHLMSLISMLDHDLALTCRSMLPIRLQTFFAQRGIECIAACEDEFRASGTLSTNVLTLAPRHCVLVDGFPKTQSLLRDAGCRLEVFTGNELCLKAEGGPTCLTRPILRG
jgi:N-dimethylarginine dimethylaminohydrolase